MSYTLNTVDRPAVFSSGVPLLNDQGGSSLSGNDAATAAPTLQAEMHGNIPAVCGPVAFDTYNMAVSGDRTVTLRAGAEHNYAPVFQPMCAAISENQQAEIRLSNKCNALSTGGGKPGQGYACLLQSTMPEVTGKEE